jgi:hypothetical protein
MPKQLQKCLELTADQGSHLFHAFAVDAKIAVTRAGSGTKVNRLRRFIEEKLHVVDESKQQGGELIVQAGLALSNEFGTRQCRKHRFQRLFRFRARLFVLKRRDGMALIGRLSRHAIRTGRARRKSPLNHNVGLYALLQLVTSDFMAAGAN